MALFTQAERAFATAVSNLAYCNPFLPERIDYERQALGGEFREADAHWNVRVEVEGIPPNVERLMHKAEALAEQARRRMSSGGKPAAREFDLYEDMVLLLLFHRFVPQFDDALPPASQQPGRRRLGFYKDFIRDLEYYLALPQGEPRGPSQPAHLFACFFQLRRAFHHIFRYIIGGSPPAVRLRATVWQSIFTHDVRRYRRSLFGRMGDVATLVCGPSGTGKELVARAIGLSRYIPFDARTLTFSEDFAESFHPINLSALAPTLVESELFGHQRARSPALADRAGWLEVCKPLGTVFLDEIAEADAAIQVKLLRVLESRVFQRLGDTQPRTFRGKVIAATNRDIACQMQVGRFRADLYYRLCSDIIQTPTLHEQIAASPEDLANLILFIVRRVAGEDEAPRIAREVEEWVRTHLGMDYPWPGNVRELEQCVRNVMIRQAYQPPKPSRTDAEALAAAFETGDLTAEQILQRYCSLVYTRTGSLQETARRLGLDRRTVKAKIDAAAQQPPAWVHPDFSGALSGDIV